MRRTFLAAALAAACVAAGCDGGDKQPAPTPIAGPAPTLQPKASPSTPNLPAQKPSPARAGSGFDFYVLALSWSPSYCASEGEDANRQQCGTGRPYAFVVHGLWPQFERGYPADCATGERDVPRDLAQSLYDIMPSNGLIRQQRRKHGVCAGLTQRDYFDVVRAARNRVTVPDDFMRPAAFRTINPQDVERAFQRANPGLKPDAITTSCSGRYLSEVRICMTKGLEFRSCPEIDRRACRNPKAVMPPVRAGG